MSQHGEPARPARELQAYREIGVTAVRPWLARLLAAGFVTTICVLPASEGLRLLRLAGGGDPTAIASRPATAPAPAEAGRPADDGGLVDRAAAFNHHLLDEIARCDDWARTGSAMAAAIRPWIQAILTRVLGAGSEKVVLGRDGWLFFRPAVDSLTGPPFLSQPHGRTHPDADPVATIVDLRDQLAERGIELVLLPIPVKAAIHPERLTGHAAGLPRPLANPSWGSFATALVAAEVTVLDPAPALLRLSEETGAPVFLATDTHWTPAAVERTAVELAALLRHTTPLPPPAATPLADSTIPVRAPGDLAAMLDLAPGLDRLPRQEVLIRPVSDATGAPLVARPGAPVLLLGDSFANIYSRPELGWGATAGLGERLALHLGWPIDAITHNDDGASATRRDLARQLAADPGRLAGTRVVVWELTERELSRGDWRPIPLPAVAVATTPATTHFVHLAHDTTTVATGTVAKAAAVADPRAAPYADYVRALLLVDVACEPSCDGDRALVFVSAMADRQLTFGAGPRPGDRLRLRLRPWSEAPERLHSASRGELLDAALMLEIPLFGEEVDP